MFNIFFLVGSRYVGSDCHHCMVARWPAKAAGSRLFPDIRQNCQLDGFCFGPQTNVISRYSCSLEKDVRFSPTIHQKPTFLHFQAFFHRHRCVAVTQKWWITEYPYFRSSTHQYISNMYQRALWKKQKKGSCIWTLLEQFLKADCLFISTQKKLQLVQKENGRRCPFFGHVLSFKILDKKKVKCKNMKHFLVDWCVLWWWLSEIFDKHD